MKKKRTYPAAASRQKQEKSLVVEQLRKTPIVQIVCEKLGIARATFYRWKKEDQAFARMADEALFEGVLLMNDMAESQLLTAIRDGDMTAIMFWLRCRHASYGNKLQLNATVEHRDRTLTPEERATIRRALKLGGFS
jgi:predicted DNA binding protein